MVSKSLESDNGSCGMGNSLGFAFIASFTVPSFFAVMTIGETKYIYWFSKYALSLQVCKIHHLLSLNLHRNTVALFLD